MHSNQITLQGLKKILLDPHSSESEIKEIINFLSPRNERHKKLLLDFICLRHLPERSADFISNLKMCAYGKIRRKRKRTQEERTADTFSIIRRAFHRKEIVSRIPGKLIEKIREDLSSHPEQEKIRKVATLAYFQAIDANPIWTEQEIEGARHGGGFQGLEEECDPGCRYEKAMH